MMARCGFPRRDVVPFFFGEHLIKEFHQVELIHVARDDPEMGQHLGLEALRHRPRLFLEKICRRLLF